METDPVFEEQLQRMAQPDFIQKLAMNPTLQIGLGILGNPAGAGANPLVGIAQGLQQGIAVSSSARDAQLKFELFAQKTLAEQEDRQRKREIQQTLDQQAASLAQSDPLTAAILRSNPLAAAPILAQRAQSGRTLDAGGAIFGGAPQGPYAPPGAPAPMGGPTLPPQEAPQGPVPQAGPPQAPQDSPVAALEAEAERMAQIAQATQDPATMEQALQLRQKAAQARVEEQQRLAQEQRATQTPDQIRAAAADVEKELGPAREVISMLTNIEDLLNTGSPLAAGGAIQLLQRAFDPQGVVRDSDVARIVNSQSLLGRFQAFLGHIANGNELTAQQKQEMVSTARILAENASAIAQGRKEALEARYGSLYDPMAIGLHLNTVVPQAEQQQGPSPFDAPADNLDTYLQSLPRDRPWTPEEKAKVEAFLDEALLPKEKPKRGGILPWVMRQFDGDDE
jgi:hypothetical protein